jgi:excisionase family DNA binding protein
VPPEVETAIDKRSSMAAVGNLNDYVKFQMAQGLEKGGGGGAGGFAAEMAVGMAMAQGMMQQQGGILGPQATPPAGGPSPAAAVPPVLGANAATAAAAAPARGALPDLMSPADAARALGVTEADVLASINDGSLKAKKIGSAFRITRAALDEFLKS